MFHNHTNQLPLFVVNRPAPNEPPPRYTRREREFINFDGTSLCLGTVVVLCIFLLLFLIVLGQVFIFHQLERTNANCIAIQSLD